MVKSSSARIRNGFAFAAVVLFVIACMLPAYSDGTRGLLCLLAGWSSISHEDGFVFMAWLANVPAIIAWFLFAFRKESDARLPVLLSAGALIMSFGMFALHEINDHVIHYVQPAPGAYVWMVSIAVLFTATFIQYRKNSAKSI